MAATRPTPIQKVANVVATISNEQAWTKTFLAFLNSKELNKCKIIHFFGFKILYDYFNLFLLVKLQNRISPHLINLKKNLQKIAKINESLKKKSRKCVFINFFFSATIHNKFVEEISNILTHRFYQSCSQVVGDF